MDQQYQPAQLEHVASPTLEALYNDLDMFINELSSTTTTSPTSNKKYGREIPPLELDKSLVSNYLLNTRCVII
jgi:hypothetical protein